MREEAGSKATPGDCRVYEAIFEALATRQVETDEQFLSLLPSVASGEAQKLFDEAKAGAAGAGTLTSIIEGLDALFKVPPVVDLKEDWAASGRQASDEPGPDVQPTLPCAALPEDADGMSPVALAQEKVTCILDAPKQTMVQVDNLFSAGQDVFTIGTAASAQAASHNAPAVREGVPCRLWPGPEAVCDTQHVTLPGGCIQCDGDRDLVPQEQLDQVFEAAGGVLHHLGLNQAASEGTHYEQGPEPASDRQDNVHVQVPDASDEPPSGQELDMVQAFQLDPTFDYENAPLTVRDWPPSTSTGRFAAQNTGPIVND